MMATGQRPAVVLPLDRSVTSASALGAARALTRLVSGVLHVVHVTDHPVPDHRLARLLQIAPMQEGFVFHQVRGEVAGAILDLAASVKAWMIVALGPGPDHDPERMAGQTALDLMQRSSLPGDGESAPPCASCPDRSGVRPRCSFPSRAPRWRTASSSRCSIWPRR